MTQNPADQPTPLQSNDAEEAKPQTPNIAAAISRRAFVITGGGMLLVAGAEACASEGIIAVATPGVPGTGGGPLTPPTLPPSPTTPGVVRVTVSGMVGATAGGQVVAARTDNTGTAATLDMPTPANGTTSGDVTNLQAGSYSVAYAPPSGFVLSPSSPSPLTVNVAAGGATNAAFIAQALAGSINVAVTGLTGASWGGQVSLIRATNPGNPLMVSLSAPSGGSSSGSLGSLTPGDYSATYTAPVGFVITSANPQVITVPSGGAANANFTVAVAAGTLHIAVSGLVGGAASGGTAQVVRTDITGQGVLLNVPPTGTIDSPVQPGAYRVTYTAPGGHELSPGQTNPQNVSIADGQTGDVAFQVNQVVAPPPPVGVIFNSDWSSATGLSQAALTDGGRWTIANELEVVPSTGLDFPSANCLKVLISTDPAFSFPFVQKTGLGVPAVGTSRYYRWYNRVVIADDLARADTETHPHQDGNAASDCNWLFHVYHDGGGTRNGPIAAGMWGPQFRTGSNNPFNETRWTPPPLAKNTTYCLELQIHRTGTTDFQIHVRISTAGGALLYTDADIRRDAGGLTTLANNPTFQFRSVANLGGFNAGLNGLGGTEWHPSVIYMYQGCVAIKDSANNNGDWIGAYNNGI